MSLLCIFMKKQSIILLSIVVAIIIVAGIVFWKTPEIEMTEMEKEAVIGDVSKSYIDVTVGEAKELIDTRDDLVIIDVSPFYEEGHIPGAEWYYYADGSLDEAIPNLDKDKIYLVYCHFDGPSIAGAEKLVDAGLEVYRLTGHFSGWVDAGYEVEM